MAVNCLEIHLYDVMTHEKLETFYLPDLQTESQNILIKRSQNSRNTIIELLFSTGEYVELNLLRVNEEGRDRPRWKFELSKVFRININTERIIRIQNGHFNIVNQS
jgi:hypothetical protein